MSSCQGLKFKKYKSRPQNSDDITTQRKGLKQIFFLNAITESGASKYLMIKTF